MKKDKDIVLQTKSGIFLRYDDAIGLFAYSPYTGLIYACTKSDAKALYSWTNKQVQKTDRQDFIKTIGPGWYCDIKEGEFTSPHLLPNSQEFSTVIPSRPILINWLITANCSLSCIYCDAFDIMSENKIEPTEKNIERTAMNILSLKPLVVVLTGGDPLCSPHLIKAIKILHSKVGIIIDIIICISEQF